MSDDKLVSDIQNRINLTITILIFWLFILQIFYSIGNQDNSWSVLQWSGLVIFYIGIYVGFIRAKYKINDKLKLKMIALVLDINLILIGLCVIIMPMIRYFEYQFILLPLLLTLLVVIAYILPSLIIYLLLKRKAF